MSRKGKSTKYVFNRVEFVSDSFNETCINVIKEYTEDLDNIMGRIKSVLNTDIPDNHLEMYILSLSNTLYYSLSGLEKIGIKEDICKSIRSEVYNQTINMVNGTVSDKTSQAELSTKQETLVMSIYTRAYKMLKQRVDAGYEMLNSLKKVMNKRLAELELSNSRYINKREEDLYAK